MSDVCPISGETLKEERVNHLTHLAGFIFSVIGLLFLVVYTGLHADLKTILSASVYGSTLVMLYGASSYYHGCRSIQRKSKLRVVDHACIYLLIAGSYTPFTLGPLEEAGGWLLLIVEWSLAVFGIIMKTVMIGRFQKLSTAAYLLMGWLVVLAWPTLTEALSFTTLVWVVVGGLSYTFGVVFFAWEKLYMNHAIWHVFVLGGSVCHYFAVLDVIKIAVA